MAKADIVAAAKSKFIADQDVAAQAYGEACYDGGLKDAPSGGDPLKIFTQADLDAAVKAKADADAAAEVDLQAKFDALVIKEGVEADLLAKLKALLFPAA